LSAAAAQRLNSDGTLTLTDAVIDTSHAIGDNKYGIYSFSSLTITLSGTNYGNRRRYRNLKLRYLFGRQFDNQRYRQHNATGGQAVTSYGISATGTITLTEGLVAASQHGFLNGNYKTSIKHRAQEQRHRHSGARGAYDGVFAVYGDSGTFTATSTAIDCSAGPTLPTGATWDGGTKTLTLNNVIINTADGGGDYFAIKCLTEQTWS
jgi:hypothetical protein